MAKAQKSLPPFAQHLVTAGLLADAQAQELTNQARAEERPFSLYVVEKKWVDGKVLAEAAAQFFSLPLYDLEVHQTQCIPSEFLSLEPVQQGFAIPLMRKDNILTLGVADPELLNTSEIAFSTGTRVKLILVEVNKLHALITDMKEAQSIGGGIEKIAPHDLIDFDLSASNTSEKKFFSVNTDDRPVVQYTNQLITEAIKLKASDIHFEPYENYYRIRYRIDGILHEASRASISAIAPMVARLKVLANLDIAEHRVPQDGRFKINLPPDKTVDFRISICPTLYGEKIVLRILDPDAIPLDLNLLGMEEHQRQLYFNAIQSPQGIILVTGPTGSGKTVTLYTALKLLNSVQKNICTVEDPIEIYLHGTNQVHMNAKTGMTFARALRAFLRQDPDIIMVGEIRDLETADIAIKAAETGHLVLSTLHTNNAPSAISRLANIGVDPYNIANTVILIMAQRLVRKLCDQCKKEMRLSSEELIAQGFKKSDMASLKIYQPGKCSRCNNGYRGRTGIFEVIPISPAILEIISQGGDTANITEQAHKEGMISLREAGLNKVKAGITSLEELNSVVPIPIS